MDETPTAKAGAGIGLLVLLGILTAFDSMSIDMYLPAFTTIQTSLGLSAGTVQLSLSVFLFGLAAGQAVSGPLVDAYGRKTPLLAGIVVFGVASALVALSGEGGMFLVGRFLQGLGGAAGLVIPRAIVGDLYAAANAAKIFALLVQVQSVSPIVAPVLGGLLLGAFGWRSIFWILTVFAALTAVATVWRVPETHPPALRTLLTFTNVLTAYWRLLTNRRYLGMTLSMGFVMATLFGYISGSSFVFMSHYGLTATQYSFVFSAASVGMILTGQLNFVLVDRMGLGRFLAMGFIIHVAFVGAFLVSVLLGAAGLWTAIILLFLAMSSLGLLFGGLTSESMFSAEPKMLGTASALLGVIQYLFGAAAGLVLGVTDDGTLRPYALLLFVCSALAAASWALSTKLKIRHEAP